MSTTSDSAQRGDGHPRLVFNVGEDWDGSPAREFPLVAEVTTIGSSPSAELQLAGLLPEHARIVHEDDDEYVLIGSEGVDVESASAPNDATSPRNVLRTGAKVQLGSWSMFFSRDELTEHGHTTGEHSAS